MTIAEKITRAKADYDNVYEAGVTDGRKSEYDAFWDNYQENGKRTNYDGAFFGTGWTAETFKPKYDIEVISASHTFRQSQLKCDLAELLEEQGVKLDFSQCNSIYYTFYQANLERIGVIDGSKAYNFSMGFSYCTAKIIDKIIVKPIAEFAVNDFRMPNLEEIRFEGTIANTGLNFQYSTNLSKASITSIINCLSTTTSGLTVTLSKVAVNKAFETSTGVNDGTTSAEWLSLIATKSNWTISLV